MKRILIGVSLTLMLSGALSSCLSLTKGLSNTQVDVPLSMEKVTVSHRYENLDKSISLTVNSSVSQADIYNDDALDKSARKMRPKYNFTPEVGQFAQSGAMRYMQQSGFNVTPSGDYRLIIDVKTFAASWLDKKSVEAHVSLTYTLKNEAYETVIPLTTVSAREKLDPYEPFGLGLGRVYGLALDKIDWERIARYLKVAKHAKDEKNATVRGDGDTALENTVIRWFIISTPQGADVSWRVISSTPDVKNTNSNYVGTTPYETTESFDIKGLTYNNSGNVQIEITCERAGYLPQKKRFNVRQAIDQREISAKFNLVKDE